MSKIENINKYVNAQTLTADVASAAKTVSKKIVTGHDRATPAMLTGLKQNVMSSLQGEFGERLREEIEGFSFLYPTRPEGNEALEYDAGLDECAERAAAPYFEILSQNWLGVNTIDTQLHLEGNVDALIRSFAAEMWKEMVGSLSGPEVLAQAGMDVDAWALIVNDPAETEANAAEEAHALEQAVSLMSAYSKAFAVERPLEFYEALDNATDSDDILATGSFRGLIGSKHSDLLLLPMIRALQGFRRAKGTDVALQELLDLVSSHDDSVVVEVPAPAERPKAEIVKKAPKVEPAAEEGEASFTFTAEHAQLVQETLGLKDKEIAEALSVTRQTWAGYRTGKREFIASETQMQSLCRLIDTKAQALETVRPALTR